MTPLWRTAQGRAYDYVEQVVRWGRRGKDRECVACGTLDYVGPRRTRCRFCPGRLVAPGSVDESARGLERVRAWSLRIHGATDRHDWCLAAAAAALEDRDPPPFPGRPQAGVPEGRLDTIRRLLEDR